MHRSKILPLISICLLLTSCVYRQERLAEARKAIPTVRQYLIEQITDLTKSEKKFIQKNKPFFGHANYIVYYFKWFDFTDESVFTVETSGPPFKPYKAKGSIVLIDPAPCDSQSDK
jgi:hypothetical protein